MNTKSVIAKALGAALFVSSFAFASPVYTLRVGAPGVRPSPPAAAAAPAPVGINIVNTGGIRTWSDGSLAASCLAYMTGDSTHSYSGATGDGTYRIQLASGANDVACDMTRDNGGWTLVLKAPAGAPNVASWGTTGALLAGQGGALATSAWSGNAGKLSDADINALVHTGYRVDAYFNMQRTRYVKPTCVYDHYLALPSTACQTTYDSIAWANPRVGTLTSGTARGIVDYIGTGLYVEMDDTRGVAGGGGAPWFAGTGTGMTINQDYGGYTNSNLSMWVK